MTKQETLQSLKNLMKDMDQHDQIQMIWECVEQCNEKVNCKYEPWGEGIDFQFSLDCDDEDDE